MGRSTIPGLDNQTCEMIKELCCACALGIDRIAKQKNLPSDLLAKLFIFTFETIANNADMRERE